MGRTSDAGAIGERAALWALAVTAVLILLKFLVWVATGSLVVLSQALDSVLDLVALSLLFFGIRVARKPADLEHHYGHAKAENLVAFTQTLLIGVVVFFVVVEAITRLQEDSEVAEAPWYALALLTASLVIDVVRVTVLYRAARTEGSEALRAGALNIAGDVGTAVVALVSLALVRLDIARADAVGALVVAAVLIVFAWRLGRRSVDVLMDRAPERHAEAILRAAEAAPGVREARRVRVRGSGDRLFADVTIAAGRTASLERAHDIAETVEDEVARVAPGIDVVVHVEPISETHGMVERVAAAASRTENVHEVHNVLVHAFDEGGKQKLHVTLHAKVEPGLSLKDAHDLSDAIEASIEKELAADVRVDTHIEPLQPTTFGQDVTSARADVVEKVRRLALEEPDVIDCHEVLVTSTAGELSIVAHVHGRADLPLALIHDASTRIETAIHSVLPEVGAVLIHFEPS
ncbi:MAG: cation diffusion facilitator family transporter [Actinomycetota bacterium]